MAAGALAARMGAAIGSRLNPLSRAAASFSVRARHCGFSASGSTSSTATAFNRNPRALGLLRQ
jgi:hypothetical protein